MKIKSSILATALLASSALFAHSITDSQLVTLEVDSNNTFEIQTSALTIHIDDPHSGSQQPGSGGIWSYSNNTSVVKKVTAQLFTQDGSAPQAYSAGLQLTVNFTPNMGSGTLVPNVVLNASVQNVLTDIPPEGSGGGSISYVFQLTSDIPQDTIETRMVKYTYMDQV
jgi:hypothetical protein